MKRVVRVRKVVSSIIWAYRGMAAGSGFATTEMRVVMINLVEKALRAHPSVAPTICVDDLAAESMGPNGWIRSELGGVITVVVQGFMGNCFELSGTKSLVTASTDELGMMMGSFGKKATSSSSTRGRSNLLELGWELGYDEMWTS